MRTTFDLLASQPFLAGLTEYQLVRLAGCARRSMFHAGTRVFHEGDPADQCWLLRSGSVDLDAETPGGGTVVIETLGPGAVLGWSWMFPPYRWHFGAVAVETTATVQFDGTGVRGLCQQDPSLGYELSTRFMQVMVNRLQASRRRLVLLSSAGNSDTSPDVTGAAAAEQHR